MCILEKGSDQLPMQKSASTIAIMSYDLMVIKRKHLLEYAFQAIVFVSVFFFIPVIYSKIL